MNKVFDALGTEIKPGAYVIYNLSGDLAVGKVESIFYKTSERCCTGAVVFSGHVKIRYILHHNGQHNPPNAGISKVKALSGIIVINGLIRWLVSESMANLIQALSKLPIDIQDEFSAEWIIDIERADY